MSIPHSLARAARNAVETSPILQDPAALRAPQRPQLRRYEVSSLQEDGTFVQTRHIAPALPLFENAFCAFSRGSLIETDQGPMAIEDLLPGDRVITGNGSAQEVLWKGSTTLVPGRPDKRGRTHHLYRIMADSFGMQRPLSGVIAGPSARLKATPAHLRHLTGGEPMLVPMVELVDGMGVIETAPPTPVELFHICLRRHALINVDGLEFETYHPGVNAVRVISHAMRSLYLNLFPHIYTLTDFGPQILPRGGEGEIDKLIA
ncbi:Hint domain-containing protein [Lutimaribacter marinistellae]|uniref:Hint domain-containing protein n=1 Tax=Lutimaribacter marinistellae TaxID=1820329 RepID=A0ABV7TFI1_9RHOB